MAEDTFAFIIHPVQVRRDAARKFPIAHVLPEFLINYLSQFFPPLYISEITGVTSQHSGKEIRGWFLAVPFTSPMMLRMPVERVYDRIVATGHKAEALGAKTLGLGAFTSVVGDAGVTIADRLDIPVTTGDSYTVAVAVQALQEAAEQMGIPMAQATVAIVGANGAIGRACAQLLSSQAGRLVLVGRRLDAVETVREQCQAFGASDVRASVTISDIYTADLVLTVTSAVHAIIEPQHLKPGAVVLDVARPRDVSRQVEEQRDDVLVVEGGMVEVPGINPDFHFDFGFPPRKVFACMAETMILAMESRYEDYTIGRNLDIERVREIEGLADKHGFKLSGLRAFEHAIPQSKIDAIREQAQRNLQSWKPAYT